MTGELTQEPTPTALDCGHLHVVTNKHIHVRKKKKKKHNEPKNGRNMPSTIYFSWVLK
jgi:hypothetical protein